MSTLSGFGFKAKPDPCTVSETGLLWYKHNTVILNNQPYAVIFDVIWMNLVAMKWLHFQFLSSAWWNVKAKEWQEININWFA